MIIEKSMSPDWLSNTYLVADREGGHAVLIDTGGPTEPILAAIERLKVTVTHVLCTHHHYDHIANNDVFRTKFSCPVCAHEEEIPLFSEQLTSLKEGDELVSGDLHIRPLHIPGHTKGQLAFLVNEERVFTGDTLFRHSVGGTRAPGHTHVDDLRHSIMEVLMKLPPKTLVHPGHTDPSTIGDEWENNPFVLCWRGKQDAGSGTCLVKSRPATLLLQTTDYDGGTKCWVRYPEGGEDVVPGSWVRDAP